MSQANVNLTEKNSQFELVLSSLKDIFAKVLGVSKTEIDVHTNFFELGLESLLFIQVKAPIKEKFGLDLSFRLLLENCTTINELAIYIAEQIPAEIPENISIDAPKIVKEKPEFSVEKRQSKHPEETAIARLVAQQLALMSKQLELLSSNTNVTQTDHRVETFNPTPPQPQPKPKIPPKAKTSTLNSQQQKHLDSLIASIVKRTPKSKQLTQEDRPYHANVRAAMGFRPSLKEMRYPIYPQRGENARIWDIDGNEYVDMIMGFGALLFGHSPSFIIEPIQNYLQQGIQHGPQSILAGKVAKLICELTNQERVAFCNDGTEAVMGAIRTARTVTGRSKIAYFAGSYHGTLDDVLMMGVANEDGTLDPMAIAPGIPQYKVEQTLILDYGNPESLEIVKNHAHELAAILVEPIQSTRPDLQPKEFLHELRRITTETGVLLIFDEIITGFRMHPGGIQALWDIRADLTTYGKAVGAGMPIGILAGKAAFMDVLDGGFWQYGDDSSPHVETTHFKGTFFKHPLVMTAAWASLNYLKEQGGKLQEELTAKTSKLAATLNSYFEEKQLPIQVVYFGSLFRFTYSPTLNWMDLFFYHLLDKGIYALDNRRFFLSTAHTEEDIERFIRAVQESIVEMQVGGFLPSSKNDLANKNGDSENSANLNTTIAEITSKFESPKSRNLPLGAAQKEIWFMAQMGEEVSRAYNQSATIHLRGSFNFSAMQKAIQEIVNRHEALRTTFSPEGDHQRIHSTWKVELPLIDFSNLGSSEISRKLSEFLAQEAQQTFDFQTGDSQEEATGEAGVATGGLPLLRTKIVKLAEQHHLLVLTIHHIIADGWSFGVLQQELAEIYTAECQNLAYNLPQPMQLSDYIHWELQQQNSPEMAKAEAYWTNQFTDRVPVLELPTDRPRPAINRHVGTRQSITLNTSLFQALKSLSVKQKNTFFTTLFASFVTLLHRLSDQEDIVVGITSAGQSTVQGEYLVGHYVNLLPIRSKVSENLTFTEYLNSIKGLLSDAYDRQIYPFINLVKKLNLPRDPSRSPLVTAIFNLDRPLSKSTFAGGEIDFERNPTGATIADIFFDVRQTNEQLLVECEYNSDLFNAETIYRWLKHWQTLLESIVNNPEEQIWNLPLLATDERKKLLWEWNNTQTDYQQDRCIHELFAAQVERTPDDVAVISGEEKLTYRELNSKANQLAHYLQKLGVKPEVLVGICLERSHLTQIATLAILKAGGAYVPLDPAYPQERLEFMLEDAQAPILLTQQHLVDKIPTTNAQVICLDTDETIAQESSENPVSNATIDNLAYVIYTSGSTGKPKGVLGLHKGAVNRFNWMWETYPFTPGEVCCQKTSLNFVDSIWEIFGPLLQGIPTVVISDRVVKNPQQFVETLAHHNVTRLVLVPSLLRVLLDTYPNLQQILPKLQLWISSGEALSLDLLTKFRQIVPQSTLLNLYGSSEVSADVTCYEFTPQNSTTLSVAIGRPITNTQIYLLDRHLQPVPIGVPGELYISGTGLARGYLNRPELTAERFISNPFLNLETNPQFSEHKLYKTGDLARYLPDGNLELVGRIDNQVKLRGFRIELGEIEAVLTQNENVDEAVVIARTDEPQLVAYVVSELTISELQYWLKKHLPDYMIPAIFVILDSLPLLPNGKINRQALPVPDRLRPELEAVYQAPQTELEQTIATIWQEALQVEEVGIYDNFFDLGGHSLLLVQVHSRLAKTFQLNLPLVVMFQYPTISHLTEYLSQQQKKKNDLLPTDNRPLHRQNSIKRRKKIRQKHRAINS
ncbi:MAG: amino acid adenylation domain-containing protein [Oscillatoria sp. PMC 1051.18]|nr:amino acid adenylation domain-containing protein [Oscillatoria sp. PMC 1050.18]MEC5029456.1 amino acid adenylation domain-containing protein [Oscillatoria sp. PMC 1051.18]